MSTGLRHRRSRQGARTWVARGLAAGLLTFSSVVGAAVSGIGTASASAATPTIDCDTASHTSADWTTCQKLVGTAKCVWNNKDGTYTLAVGYTNPTADNLFASTPNTGANTGAYNAFTATNGYAANPGHASTFYPGTYTTAWTVTWTPSSKRDPVSWALMGNTYTWYDSYTACPTKPVPVIGNDLVGGTGLVLLTSLGLLGRRRFKAFLAATRLAATGTG